MIHRNSSGIPVWPPEMSAIAAGTGSGRGNRPSAPGPITGMLDLPVNRSVTSALVASNGSIVSRP